jgi:hypothetical protein
MRSVGLLQAVPSLLTPSPKAVTVLAADTSPQHGSDRWSHGDLPPCMNSSRFGAVPISLQKFQQSGADFVLMCCRHIKGYAHPHAALSSPSLSY